MSTLAIIGLILDIIITLWSITIYTQRLSIKPRAIQHNSALKNDEYASHHRLDIGYYHHIMVNYHIYPEALYQTPGDTTQ